MNLLLEIGTEEIPHWMIPGALKQLAAFDLFGAEPNVDATPRRLVLRASGVPERTPDREQIIKGPPVSAGERAAAGFAKKQGVELSALRKSGDYYELSKLTSGRRAVEILSEALPAAIVAIQWPKTMYWTAQEHVLLGPASPSGYSGGTPMDVETEKFIRRSKHEIQELGIHQTAEGRHLWRVTKKQIRFIRPIRWLVAMLDDQVIPFEIAGVKSGNITRGHRQLGAAAIPVTVANYESELRKNFVILSSDERRRKIEVEAKKLGAKPDADLLETLTFITEYPTAIRGDFDPAFLELPAEVLTTVMRHHQKYFSVEGAPGKLAPSFVAIMNTSGDPEGLVKHGNERVLKARFNDARFFWNVDQTKKLEERVPDLAKVTFQAKLGSYLDKTKRVKHLVFELEGNEHAQRAALLAKCDLTTEMVKEFTDLQGVVGGLYAKAQGEPEPVWRAIYDHYKPVGMEDSIPATHEGQILALADKLDTLRECFKIGMVPTGSKDPFALRRAAQGVVKILAEAKLDYNFHALFEDELSDFMMERVQHYFREIRGFKYDEVNAVLASSRGTLADLEDRLTALAEVRPTENFEPLAASFKRIRNILKQADFEPDGGLQEHLIEPGPERDLYEHYKAVQSKIQGAGYRVALEQIASLRPSVDTFFDKILVNAKQPEIRINRLTLLHDLLSEFSTIADFAEITTGEQK